MDLHAARTAMVETQVRPNDVTDAGLLAALSEVAREDFVPPSLRAVAYAERALETSPGRYILPARDFAKLVQAAALKPTDRVLNIAPGLGYSTAILARLAGSVVSLESDEAAAAALRQSLSQHGVASEVVAGELSRGAAAHGPFDAIFLFAAVTAPPQAWLDQLRDGGRCVFVVRSGVAGHACVYRRSGADFASRNPFDASAPLLKDLEEVAAFRF